LRPVGEKLKTIQAQAGLLLGEVLMSFAVLESRCSPREYAEND
jgi:hypothetical protein